MENKTFNLFIILLCHICFSNSSSLFMWTANTCATNSHECRSEEGTCLGLMCWQTMRPHSFFLRRRHSVGCSCLASEYSLFFDLSQPPHYWRRPLCRGLLGLPRARSRALGKGGLCRGPALGALGKSRPSAKKPLPRVRPSSNKQPSAK